ncbi:MAG: M20/M25/M40 family metallo-hydrolase [candidate division KSB1 bacterium]|jgi:D-alanine-D-alanine ligase|nr:M20/M25/M40 family metallo-hydrolase [candidate division KSB1 bacterium]
MKVAIIYNKDFSKVINQFGMQNKEVYNERTVNNVVHALETYGHNVQVIDGNMEVIDNLQNFMPKVIEGERMGMVFNMAYGIQGESRYTHIPSMLEMLGIPYIGSNPSGHALGLDKVIAKILMQKQGIPTPDFWVYSNHNEDMSDVKYPVIVKPKMEAVSFGLKVVHNEKDLREAVEFIIGEFEQQALVEQFIRGREFAIGVIGNSPSETFPILEIDLDNDPDAIQTVDDKKKKPRKKICPADVPESLAKKMQEASIKAFKALQLNDFARVDIRLDEHGNFYILEINSMASLGTTGSYTFAAKAAGLGYNELINKMLNVAAYRYFGDDFLANNENSIKGEKFFNVKLKSFIRNRQHRYEKYLSEMVNINSHVNNPEGVNQVSAYVRARLSNLGFSHQVIPQSVIGNVYFYTNSADEYDILLLGNIDNSTNPNNRKYFLNSEKKYYGTGVWSNKGGLTVMLAALEALQSLNVLKNIKIGILLTTDSSQQNRISASIIKNKAVEAKYVLGLTGASPAGGIITSRSGAGVYKVEINLKNNEKPENISVLTNKYLNIIGRFMNLSDKNKDILIAPSDLSLKSNIIQHFAFGTAVISIRFNKNNDFREIKEQITRLVPKTQKTLDIQITGGHKRPAMERNNSIDELWNEIKTIALSMDISLREEHRWSSSDICFVGDNQNKIDGLGPVGDIEKNSDEYILKHSLLERTALLAIIIEKLK